MYEHCVVVAMCVAGILIMCCVFFCTTLSIVGLLHRTFHESGSLRQTTNCEHSLNVVLRICPSHRHITMTVDCVENNMYGTTMCAVVYI